MEADSRNGVGSIPAEVNSPSIGQICKSMFNHFSSVIEVVFQRRPTQKTFSFTKFAKNTYAKSLFNEVVGLQMFYFKGGSSAYVFSEICELFTTHPHKTASVGNSLFFNNYKILF